MLLRDMQPDIAVAQFRELARQVPLLYTLLVVNTAAAAYTHYGIVPDWLTVWTLLVVVGICASRMVNWIRLQIKDIDADKAIGELRRTLLAAALFSTGYIVWSLTLEQYNEAHDHAAFSIAIMVIGCIICLTHLPQAALLVMMIVTVPFLIYFIARHEPVFAVIAMNIFFICLVMFRVLLNQYDGFIKLVGSRSDLAAKQNETVRLSRENARLAHTDPLTCLPNRRYFFYLVNYEIEKARASGETFAVGVLDLDHFKPVNDTYGHKFGDMLLEEVGKRLKKLECCEISACRLGGDEFGLIVRSQSENLENTGRKICELISEPYLLNDKKVVIGGSCGFSVFPDAGQTAHELFDRADYALYNSKREQRGEVTIYSASHEADIQSERAIEGALVEADLETETSVEFQPIIDLRDNRIAAFEALARWDSPTVGTIPPSCFIPIAERCGMIHTLTLSLFQKSLQALSSMPEHIGLSYNLSTHDITADRTVLSLITAIQQAGIDPERITFEITESSVAKNFQHAEKSLHMLRSFGTHLTLDDFGTGCSSLSCLHRLPFTKVKVGRSFVTGLTQATYSVAESILTICKNMELEGIMDGVETKAQLEALRSLGCYFAQGCLLGRSMSVCEAKSYAGRMPTHVQAVAQ